MDDRITRVYIGGPLFTSNQKEVLEKVRVFLDEDDRFEYFSPGESSADIWKGRAPKNCSEDDRQRVFEDNYMNVVWADVLVAWIGGMDEITNKAGNNLVDRINDDSKTGTVYPGEIDNFLDEYVDEYKPAPSDTGVVWEMGFAYGYNVSLMEFGDDHNNYTRLGTSILAYIDDNDQRQSMNLMLERAVNGVSKGFENLKADLISYHKWGRFISDDKLPSEDVSVSTKLDHEDKEMELK